MQPKDIPNVISLLRILLSGPVAWALLSERFDVALWVFTIAGISDGLDGLLAKRCQWQSELGALLDPIADKILLVSSFLCLGWLQLIPAWLVLLVVLRDLVIVAGAIFYHFHVEHLIANPSLISKLNTTLQTLLVLLVVVDSGLVPLPETIMQVMLWSTLATTLASGTAYILEWGGKALRHHNAARHR